MGERNKIRVSIHDVYRPVHTAVCTQVYIEYPRRIYDPFWYVWPDGLDPTLRPTLHGSSG